MNPLFAIILIATLHNGSGLTLTQDFDGSYESCEKVTGSMWDNLSPKVGNLFLDCVPKNEAAITSREIFLTVEAEADIRAAQDRSVANAAPSSSK